MGKVVDEVNYSESQQFDLLSDYNGVSLERVNYVVNSNFIENWHSAASDVGYATPRVWKFTV